jgi:heme A synthase
MTLQTWIRQGHRWLGVLLTLTILANFAAMAIGKPPAAAIVYAPLAPLALLLVSGLYMFVEPYLRKSDRA